MAAPVEPRCDAPRWVGAWEGAAQATTAFSPSGTAAAELEARVLAKQNAPLYLAQAQVFSDQSFRLIVTPHLGGQALRLHFGNRFGKKPLRLDDVHAGLTLSGAAIVARSNHEVSFGGRSSVTIAPGGEAVSDAIAMPTRPEQSLSISFHIVGGPSSVDYHLTAQQTSYLSGRHGAYGARQDAGAFRTRLSSWYGLDRVDVLTTQATGLVVAFGDSITDGYLSSFDRAARWPDALARRLAAASPQTRLSVVDAGVSGNFVASNDDVFGPSGVSRFAHDAIAVPGVTDIVLLEGINDIDRGAKSAATAERIIAADKAIIAQAHAAGLNIIGATLTPAEGAKLSAAGGAGLAQAMRQQVNGWIRSSGAFDSVVDFDAAVRDPSHPNHIAPTFNGGDNLHFNDAGYAALAKAVDLTAFKGARCR